jgi:hypothetical protein
VPVLSGRPPRRLRRPPSVQSPFAQLGCYLRWGDVVRLLGERYPSVVARIGSCATPVGLSPPSVFSLVWRVLAGCNQSLLPTAASRRYSENLSLDAGSPTPAVPRVLAPVSSTVSSAFPNRVWVGFPHLSCKRLLAGQFSRMQIFRNVPASNVPASKFACPPDRSYRCEECRRAAGASTSEPLVLCRLHTPRICYPSEYRQVTVQGLSPC